MLASWLGPLALVLESTRALQIPFNSHQRTDQVKTVQHSHPVSLDSPLSASGYSSAVARPFPLPIIPPAILYPLEDVKLRSVPAKVWRPRAKGGSPQYEAARQADRARSRGLSYQTSSLQWEEIDLEAPDVTDMDTLAGLAKMTSNAYVEGDKSHKNNSGWYHFPEWELGDSFGWTEDGIRGHVFATENNETIVVAIKGTSAGLVGGGGSTSGNDKTNDNLFFSCCCARVDWSWSTVCDCYSGGWKCDEACVEDALIDKSVYYPHALDLYNNITQQYPDSNIWLTGHSLGGSLAAMLSLTFGVPCVTFEAPGDLMPSRRLHLPMPPGLPSGAEHGALTHVYHNGDPIPQGACSGTLSSCGLAGFALESRCHTGRTILFDVVNELKWAVDVRTHSIAQIIEHVLKPDWDANAQHQQALRLTPQTSRLFRIVRQLLSTYWEKNCMWWWGWGHKEPKEPQPPSHKNRSKSNVPQAAAEDDCVDCIKWDYGNFK